MKFVLAIVALACVLCLAEARRAFDLNKHPRALFKEYLQEFPHAFADDAARQARYQVFVHNLQKIKSQNVEHAGRAEFGLNKFSLMHEREFKNYVHRGVKTPRDWTAWFGVNASHMMAALPADQLAAAPASVDWRKHNPPVVTAIKDQGQCGDCWAFSSTGNIEGQWALAGHTLVSLSEQQLCSCDHVCINGQCDQGCDGGMMANAFTYVIKVGGLESESAYPYEGTNSKCKFAANKIVAKISSYKMIPHDPVQMASVVATTGPISIAVDAETWQNYNGGIIKSHCGTQLDHAVLIVGYAVSSGNVPYWIVKNSWGTDWGMDGYIYIERGTDNMCGINKYPITAVV